MMTAVNETESGDGTSRLHLTTRGDTVFFDRSECAELGTALNDTYVNNDPFPHIVIDDFLPLDVLRRVNEEFPQARPGRFNDQTSKLKTGYQMEMIESPFITNLLNALNSAQFLVFLENATGIKGLIPDPYFLGGGLHETRTGGHLSIHVDFNLHRPLRLRRRLNLILFLNEGWDDAYGGHLELWDTGMSHKVRSVAPMMARAVIFNTDPGSYHGHPDPLTTPESVTRRSIALYYYTAPEEGALPEYRTTDFQPRPGSSDKNRSSKEKVVDLMKDVTPPILLRLFKKT